MGLGLGLGFCFGACGEATAPLFDGRWPGAPKGELGEAAPRVPELAESRSAPIPVAAPSEVASGRTAVPVVGGPPECGPDPVMASPKEIEAWQSANRYRVSAGLPCVALDIKIGIAAVRHCRYFNTNVMSKDCMVSPHKEVGGCSLFTGEEFVDRMRVAGYPGEAAFEVMAYVGDPRESIRLWMDSVWHRLPFMHPRMDAMGYGTDGACDTVDFSRGPRPEVTKAFVYPYKNQKDVPLLFTGNERPAPPEPTSGWPSGYPVSLFAPGLIAETHSIAATGQSPLPHIFIGPGDARAYDLLRDEFFLYTHEPLAPLTQYDVEISGKDKAGNPASYKWSFTTAAETPPQ